MSSDARTQDIKNRVCKKQLQMTLWEITQHLRLNLSCNNNKLKNHWEMNQLRVAGNFLKLYFGAWNELKAAMPCG